MRLDLQIDRLVIRGADPDDVRAALARLPSHLDGLPTTMVRGGRIPGLRIAADAADPESLARAIADAISESLTDRAASMQTRSPTSFGRFPATNPKSHQRHKEVNHE